ncbi:MAG: rhomboid family intramembrane serine protease [archaeon]
MAYYYPHRKKRRFPKGTDGWSITTWLIIVNVIIYLFLTISHLISKLSLEEWINTSLPSYFALKSSSILQGNYLPSILLHMFSHIYFIHLFINMFVLFSLGSLCEKIIGKKRYFWFYLLAGLFAGILSIILSGFFGNSELGARIFGSPEIFMMGASGAIFAIAGLYMILLPRLKFMIIFLPFFSFPAYIIIPVALFGVWALTIIFNLPIGNVAHFGGFLVGVVYGLYLKNKYKRKVLRLQRMFR